MACAAASPWNVFHQGVAEHTGLTIGQVTVISSLALLALWVPLRQRPGLGTVANATDVNLGADSGGSGNSWNIGGTWSFTSTDPSIITGPRSADGSIPSSAFLRPSNGADVGARF